MAKSCEDVSARMMELLYGELPEGERAAIEAHLETDAGGCARCRAELAGLRTTRAIARQVLDETPPARAHQAILRAAVAVAAVSTVAERQRADQRPSQPTGPTFWEKLRARWTFPTLATVGAVAVFLLASKIFMEPEKTYERGRQGLVPVPVEAPAPAPTTAGEPATAPAAEAVRSAPGTAAPEMAAPAADAPAEGKSAMRAHAGPGATGGLSALGSGSAQIANKRRAVPERLAKESSEVGRQAYAEPPAPRRADRAFAQPPPPRSAAPSPVTAADDGEVLLDRRGSGVSRQSEGRGSGGGASDPRLAEKKSSAPAKSAAKGFGGLGNDLEGGAGAPAGQASPGTLAKAAPPRERNAGAGRAESAPAAAPAPPPPASAPMPAKRDRAEAASEEAMADEEAPVARSKKESDKSARKPPETPVAHADRLFSEGRWAEAATAYRDLLRRDPRNADAGRWRQRLAAAEAALASPSVPAPP
jgi:ribonuclease E